MNQDVIFNIHVPLRLLLHLAETISDGDRDPGLAWTVLLPHFEGVEGVTYQQATAPAYPA